MRRLLVLALFAACTAPVAAQQPAALDYEFFKVRVQPMFTTKRAGNARCVSCHAFGTPMRLQPLPHGAATWSEDDSRKNFELVKSRVVAGRPEISRLLRHPLEESAGGDPHHDGGKHWTTKERSRVADAGRLGARRDAAEQRAAGGHRSKDRCAHHPDEQRRRQRPHHRSGHQQGGRPDHRHRGRPRRRRRARRQPALREQRSRLHAGRGGRAHATGDQQGAADRAPEQHRRQPRRRAGLCRHPAGAGRRGRGGHRVAAAREEHPDQGRRAQHLRDAGRALRHRRVDRGQDPDGDRSADRGAGVGDGLRAGRAADGVRAEPRRIDAAHLRAAHRAQRLRGGGLRVAQGSDARGAAADRRREEAGAGGRQRLARDGGDRRQPAARRGQPLEQRRLRLFAAGPEARGLGGRRRGPGLGDPDARRPHRLRGQRRVQQRLGDRPQGHA